MNISLDMSFLLVSLLIFIRLSAVFLMSPLFAIAGLPLRVKLLWLLGLSVILASAMDLSAYIDVFQFWQLLKYALNELVLGAAMAFGVFCSFAAFSFGGRIVDFQMGFGVASLIDPATNAQSPLIGTFLSMLAVIVFFLLDGHHMLLRGLAYSLEKSPPGVMFTPDTGLIVKQFGMMFVFGLMVVAPVIFTILLIDVAMAVAARTMPQVNMFIVMLPLKIFVGLVVLMLSMNYILPVMKKVFYSLFDYWQKLYGL